VAELFLVLIVLAAADSGCGEDQSPDEGDFDRWDACERMVSLCGYSRDKIYECLDRIEQNYPDQGERIELLCCMKEAATCQEMIGDCMQDPDEVEQVPTGPDAHNSNAA
jgi:hypothetical protein